MKSYTPSKLRNVAFVSHSGAGKTTIVETLLHMKETGALEEDLDLDSGQWVYRMQAATDTGTAASLMLSERARGR